MRKLILLAAACSALLLADGAAATLTVGVNDDAPLDAATAPWFYSTMQTEGLKIDTLTLRWDDGSPTTIAEASAIDQAVASASALGISIELDLYPLHSMAFTDGARCAPSNDPEACGDTAKIQQFGTWAGLVAQRFPKVNEFVVMNECNQPLFVNPQWNKAGQNQSAEICGRALAAAYDAIKAANAGDTVWGVGLSPRGNDNPHAKSDSSTTPVTFLGALGSWFRSFVAKTGRTAPLMDGFDFHPYPVPQSLPFATGYANPKDASVTNLPRIYQAFFDAFNGTPQRTIGQQAGGGLLVSLNETGIQTDSSGHAGYTGTEASATAAGGVRGAYAAPEYQAGWYKQMLDLLACDPNVSFVNIFHLLDESNLAGWQSGLYYADRTPKESAQTVQTWLQETGGACSGTLHPWTPAAAADTGAASGTTHARKAKVAKGTPAACRTHRKACARWIAVARKSVATLERRLAKERGGTARTARERAKVLAQRKQLLRETAARRRELALAARALRLLKP